MEQEERQTLLPPDQTSSSRRYSGSHNDDGYSSVLPITHDNNDIAATTTTLLRATNSNSSSYNTDDDNNSELPLWTIVCLLSTAFSYGCILTTLFLITLPVECQRIHAAHPDRIHKSVALGVFVAIAGVTQLVSPLVGRLSDSYQPPYESMGRRWPYHFFGSILTVVGLLCQMASSWGGFWIRYSLAFFLHMMGLNVMYAMMLALLADQVPAPQVGVANGVLALLLVTGSLFGFGLFHSILSNSIQSMYGLYTCIVVVSSILTGTHGQERDAVLAWERRRRRRTESSSSSGLSNHESNNHSNKPAVSSPTRHHKHHHWHRRAQKAVQRAQEIMVLTPTQFCQSLLEPLHRLSWQTLLRSYTIDIDQHYDFFIVTVSRLFYYCGMSVQTFFLYFCHDILQVHDNTEAVVASLAILGQCSAAVTCYPVGVVSDQCLEGRRKPFVYAACVVLSMTTLAMVHASTVHDMVVLSCILGGANGVYLTMETSLAVDTLPSHRRKQQEQDSDEEEQGNNKEADDSDEEEDGSAQLLGIWGVAAFLGSALGPMVGGPLLYYFGSQPSVSSSPSSGDDQEEDMEEYSLAGYAVVLSLSSFYFLCSAWALRYVKNSEE